MNIDNVSKSVEDKMKFEPSDYYFNTDVLTAGINITTWGLFFSLWEMSLSLTLSNKQFTKNISFAFDIFSFDFGLKALKDSKLNILSLSLGRQDSQNKRALLLIEGFRPLSILYFIIPRQTKKITE